MRKLSRKPAPVVLERFGREWQRKWTEANARGKDFRWPIVDSESLNRKLLPVLKEQTQDHCSFCDSFPVSPPSVDTIEHFKPKAKFPEAAFAWENLFYCCACCQQRKGPRFDELALKPDEPDYDFDKFFRWDWTTGKLLPNQNGSSIHQERALVTIELFGLNDGHPTLRKRELHRRDRDQTTSIDDFAYRDYIA